MFQVTVPANHKGGDSLTVAAPDGSKMMTTVPAGLTEGQVFQIALPTAVVTATAVPIIAPVAPDIGHIVKARGALPLRDAKAFAKSIHSEKGPQRPSGCYKVHCVGCCTMGCAYMVPCAGGDCVWSPYCLFWNPLIHVAAVGVCVCPDGQGSYRDHKNEMHLIPVDHDTQTLACYYTSCGQCVDPSGDSTPCCYCYK